MGLSTSPKRVKLIVGVLSGQRELMKCARELLSAEWGECDFCSGYWPFEHTHYYAAEMGNHIEKHFISFETLVDPATLAGIKTRTNALEQEFCASQGRAQDCRPINLDPGYLTLSKLVLASTKDYSHRIYLQSGIYAETTRFFKSGQWHSWPWTYPDYASGQYDAFFMKLREKLKSQYASACRMGRENQGGA